MPQLMEATVAGIRFLGDHHAWEDWVGMLIGMVIGVLIGISPWLAEQQDDPAVMGNTLLVGLTVFGLAELVYLSAQRGGKFGEIACGLWLIASPFTFSYTETVLAIWHSRLGAVIVLLAALELWREWRLSDNELAQHVQQ
jgi:uncharacterized membrane protein YczE